MDRPRPVRLRVVEQREPLCPVGPGRGVVGEGREGPGLEGGGRDEIRRQDAVALEDAVENADQRRSRVLQRSPQPIRSMSVPTRAVGFQVNGTSYIPTISTLPPLHTAPMACWKAL